MGKGVEVSTVVRSDDSTESGAENDAFTNDASERELQDALLLDNQRPQISVGKFYLLSLTCGVGGYVNSTLLLSICIDLERLQVVWSVILSNGSVRYLGKCTRGSITDPLEALSTITRSFKVLECTGLDRGASMWSHSAAPGRRFQRSNSKSMGPTKTFHRGGYPGRHSCYACPRMGRGDL